MGKLSHFVSYLLDLIYTVQHTVMHKFFTVLTGTFAGYITVAGVVDTKEPQLGYWEMFFQYFTTMNPLQMLSFLCLFTLLIDRSLIIWAWYKRIKRGDYNLPNVGKKK